MRSMLPLANLINRTDAKGIKRFTLYFALHIALPVGALICHSGQLHAQVYSWKQPDGTVVYSDEPGPNSKEIEVKELPIVNLPTPPQKTITAKEISKPEKYTTLAITSPSPDTTINDNTGNLAVTLSIVPPLQNEHLVQLTIDGSPLGSPGTSTTFQVKDLHRGSHQIAIQVLSKKGQVIQSSPSVTVHIKRFSALH